jgi:hypothetical protein
MKRVTFILTFTLLSGVCFGSTNALYSDALSWTGQVYIAILGDSIVNGYGATNSDRSIVLSTSISNASGGKITATNFSIGGSIWNNGSNAPTFGCLLGPQTGTNNWRLQPNEQTMYGQITNGVFDLHPRFVLAHFGRNDVFPFWNVPTNCGFAPSTEAWPTYWTVIERAINDAYTNCRAHNAFLLLSEILPAYGPPSGLAEESGILSVTNINLNMRWWTQTNPGSYILIQHDAFGVWDTNTPGYNLLNPLYMFSDGLHINNAGYDLWGPLIVSNLGNFFSDPATINTSTVKAVTLRMSQ